MAAGFTHSHAQALKNLPPLRFRGDGTFRILHLTDIHKVCPEMDDDEDKSVPFSKSAETLRIIDACIEQTQPDLIVFGGDNIGGHWDEMTDAFALRCLSDILSPVIRRNIPLAAVFGNHDAQNEKTTPLLSREIQMSLYMNYANFRGCFNEADVYGCGNYHIPVLDSAADRPLWNIWCMDSNDYPRDGKHNITGEGYDLVHEDQIAWYENTVKAEKEKYGRTVPAVLFQHIPVREEFDFIEECSKEEADYEAGGKFFRAKAGELKEGLLRESPCPPSEPCRQFSSWVECGDIKAAFFGHDHTNTFCFEKDGIKLYQTISAGCETYGAERGGRLITLFADGKTIKTETVICG